ncbi:JAB domain-containing protein [Aquisalimonas sp.]|uniref:JAB domain-containing protein n=1 Tax=Aquisalimonas sp. TaxID=1872621 RepID=UPI0025BBBD43|nr:JAB domain-containing protein [Aquisalimonas sp.]
MSSSASPLPPTDPIGSARGAPHPSDADRRVTRRLKEALRLLELLVIDHIVVGSEGCESSAELSNGTHDAITP